MGKLLEEFAGIRLGAIGAKNLARAVRERMFACNLTDDNQYFEKVRSSSVELEALIESVVVPETSFFRDKGPFTYLGRYVCDEWRPLREADTLRILSAPCSSGEEPYSIAIVLQEAGLKAGAYEIDALDISPALLGKAESATYTRHSFRGVSEPLRNRYFASVGQNYVLSNAVRIGVRFFHGNLMDEDVLADIPPYDIVFCRNLLIYFGAEARARVIRTIERLVARNGLLFVGHAETSCFRSDRFAPLDQRGAFGFRKIESKADVNRACVQEHDQTIASLTPSVETEARTVRETNQPQVAAHDKPKPKDSFEAARQLADRGLLQEAAAMCVRLLENDRTSADAHCLLGAVMHGLGDLQRAEECFNRAIYLDETCYDAVVHLSLIKEHRGDLAGARVLRQRAARIQPQARIQ